MNIILKTSFKSDCGRFLLDIYRPFLNISRTFALTVWVSRQLLLRCSNTILLGCVGLNNRKKPLNLSAIIILATDLTDFLRIKDHEPMIAKSNRVYAIRNHKRSLTRKTIWKLHEGLGIPAGSLIKPPQAQ